MKNMLDNLEAKIIKEIKENKIKPLGRPFFIIKKVITWLLVFVFLALCGLSLSVLLMIVRHGDFDIYRFFGTNESFFFFKAFPYFWLLAVLIFLFFAFFRFKKTDGSYNYPVIYSLLASLLAIIIFTSIFYFSGLGRRCEAWLAGSRLYRQTSYLRSAWENPDKGLLSGVLKIENLEQDNQLIYLEDFSGKRWLLDISENNVIGENLIDNNKRIKMIGEISGEEENVFKVLEFRPWECGCAHCQGTKGASCSSCSNNSCSNNSCSDNSCSDTNSDNSTCALPLSF